MLGPSITFKDGEASVKLQPQIIVLMIVADIDHVPTHRVLLDGGSSANVFTLRCCGPSGGPLTS